MRTPSALILCLALSACDGLNLGDEEGFVRGRCASNFGWMVFNIDVENAPLSSENFLSYFDRGFYDGRRGGDATLFDTVEPGRRVIAGRKGIDGRLKPTDDPVPNELGNGLTNERGSIAVYHEGDPDSGTAGFFINLSNNPDFDGVYTVFGSIDPGMNVVDQIAGLTLDEDRRPRRDMLLTDCHRL
ncbi:MAG: hypothetical protein EA397_16525 [Deltaproteobacteria bacterium]|nr:MAG: hypothetical protein EA397_16525 [Deltaproteobacteria bacterium]